MNFNKRKIFCFAAVFVVLISVYLYTIAPTVSLWDCGEFIACSHILGVPHPPGTPFYILLGRIFDILFPFKEVAKRVNFLSALSAALAGAILYLVILKVISRFKENKGEEHLLGTHLIAVFSSIGAGLCFSVWDTSVEAEVYALSILIMVLGLWLTLLWSEHLQEKGDNNYLLLLMYLLFLSIGVHLLPLLILPGVLVFLILINWKVLKDPRLIGMVLFLALIGFSTYFVLMIRAYANPGINEANPTTFAKLWEVFSRKQYGKMDLYPRHTSWETNLALIPAFIEQLKVFFKYFSWQFFPYPRTDIGVLLRYLSLFGTYIYILTGVWGMWVHFKKDKESFWLFFILYILLTLGLVVYLNHEFSPSDPNPAHQPREPRERDYFWSPGFFLFMFYVSIGLYWIWSWLKQRIPRYALGGLLLSGIMGFIPLVSNINSHVNRRGNWLAHDYARSLLVSPDEYSILFTYGDNDTFPVWFMQEVKDFRRFDADKKKGVRLANFSLMNTNWYIKEFKWSKVPIDFASPFIGTRFAAEYNRQKRSGLTNSSFEEWVMDAMPTVLRVNDGRIIELKDMAVRSIILTAIGKEPTLNDIFMRLDSFVEKYINNEDFNPSVNIYFSFPIPPDYRNALSAHLIREGVVYKLVKDKVDFKSDRGKTWGLFNNKFSYSYYDNFWMCIGSEAQVTTLVNLAFSLFTFSEEVIADIYPSLYYSKITEPVRDTLKMLESLLNKVTIYAEDENLFLGVAPALIGNQKLIYKKLGNYDEGLQFVNSFLRIKDVPRLRLLRGELLIVKAKNTGSSEEAKKILTMAEDDFNKLVSLKRWEQFAYKGFIEIYVYSGEEEKLEKIIDELVADEKMFSTVFMLLERDDVESAIELIKRVKRRFPRDKYLDEVLDSLEVRR
jgi:tetratricopeptide (TPR) repeat protein